MNTNKYERTMYANDVHERAAVEPNCLFVFVRIRLLHLDLFYTRDFVGARSDRGYFF